MRIAAFTDVHANLSALKSVLEKIHGHNPDKIIFLGDIFAKGSQAIECLELLRNSSITCIAGNHELFLLRGVEIDSDAEPKCYISILFSFQSA